MRKYACYLKRKNNNCITNNQNHVQSVGNKCPSLLYGGIRRYVFSLKRKENNWNQRRKSWVKHVEKLLQILESWGDILYLFTNKKNYLNATTVATRTTERTIWKHTLKTIIQDEHQCFHNCINWCKCLVYFTHCCIHWNNWRKKLWKPSSTWSPT